MRSRTLRRPALLGRTAIEVRNPRRGAAALEFALCLPIIMLLLLGTMDACNMIYMKQSLTIAAYEGGRTALIPGTDETGVIADCTQVVTDRGIQNAQVIVDPKNFDEKKAGTFVTISVTAPCNDNTFLAGRFFSGREMSGEAEVMKEFD